MFPLWLEVVVVLLAGVGAGVVAGNLVFFLGSRFARRRLVHEARIATFAVMSFSAGALLLELLQAQR